MVLQGLTNYFSKKLPTLKKSDEEFSGRPYLQDLTDARFPETQLWLHSVTITILQYTYIYIYTLTQLEVTPCLNAPWMGPSI